MAIRRVGWQLGGPATFEYVRGGIGTKSDILFGVLYLSVFFNPFITGQTNKPTNEPTDGPQGS